MERSLLVVDAANVVGSVPDGWWRDRKGAAERLRDQLAGLADDYDVVMVVEGAARGIDQTEGVRVVDAEGEGDDAIVDLVGTHLRVNNSTSGDEKSTQSGVIVVTADRELRDRVTALGAEVRGPRWVR